jgi:hypothetical protein
MYDAIPSMQKEADGYIQILSDMEDDLYDLESKYFAIYEENENLKKKLENSEEKLKDFEIKLQDFNIIDLLKANTEEGSDMNIVLGLISNAEKKANAKHKLIDEKIAKIDQSCFKMTKDVQNVKNSQDLNKRQFDAIKQQLEDLHTYFESLNKTVDVNNEEINDKLESKIKYLENSIKETLEEFNKGVKNKLNDFDKNMLSGKELSKDTLDANEIQNMNFENNVVIKGLKEAIGDIYKKLKSLPNQSDLEQIRTDIISLKSAINNCARISDFKDLKDVTDDNKMNIKKIREDFEDYQNSQTENIDIPNIKRKLEIVINKVHDMEENDNKKISKNVTKTTVEDKNKFIENKNFDDFKAQIVKEFNNINDNFINSRKLLDELIDSVRNRTSFKDLKALEDAVMSQMEELKISSSKKFADRNEVNKTIKYLDQQIRNIVQIYIKKIDKGENWLLAKKPITNNLCASCESYIGDLKDTNDNNLYIPWNKYPVKDPNDKLYRMGHGFSKMLQMIQVDENDKKSAFQTYHNDAQKNKNSTKTDFLSASGFDVSELSPHNKTIKNLNNNTVNMNKTTQKSLPKLNKHKLMKKNANLTTFQEQNLNMNDESDENEDEPKITKIFRVTKDQH